MSINDITGDKLISKPSTKAYEDGWERIFGKKDKNASLNIEALWERAVAIGNDRAALMYPEEQESARKDAARRIAYEEYYKMANP